MKISFSLCFLLLLFFGGAPVQAAFGKHRLLLAAMSPVHSIREANLNATPASTTRVSKISLRQVFHLWKQLRRLRIPGAGITQAETACAKPLAALGAFAQIKPAEQNGFRQQIQKAAFWKGLQLKIKMLLPGSRSRIMAFILGLFLGLTGAHRFYLGYAREGWMYLLGLAVAFGFFLVPSFLLFAALITPGTFVVCLYSSLALSSVLGVWNVVDLVRMATGTLPEKKEPAERFF